MTAKQDGPGQAVGIDLACGHCCESGMLARLVVSAASLVALLTVGLAQATACEKHLNGHQNNSETNSEVQGR